MRAVRRLFTVLLVIAVVATLGVLGLSAWSVYNREPLPFQDQCAAQVAGETIRMDVEQAHYASIIAGVATQRGLVPRATTIGLATAYQESGVRNLDHGDRDSLGLFQQRPSQGWGTPEQVTDPWYSAGAFYEALVKVPGWESGDVNDVAQTVQRSGHPYAYAKHVEKARRVASALTGETPASFSCIVRSGRPADPDGLAGFLGRTLPADVAVVRTPSGVRLTAPNGRGAWSASAIVVANAGRFGVRDVAVGGRTWRSGGLWLPTWSSGQGNSTVVEVTTG